MGMLYSLEPTGPYVGDYPAMSLGISKAANEDPLVSDHEAGGEVTAAILVAAAWHATRFHPNMTRGRRMGMYQVTVPQLEDLPVGEGGKRIDGKLLLLPFPDDPQKALVHGICNIVKHI